MYRDTEQQLSSMLDNGLAEKLHGGLIGLEKESLRVGPDGSIAQTPHPAALGSALTHPWITTDYSEALLEFITPPLQGARPAIDFLRDLQHFAYRKLDNELLWSASMPCVVPGESDIPLARYGSSNIGIMKTVYRRGLGYRYGRVMQVIAGGHFNYSFPEAFWPGYRELLGSDLDLQDFISDRYFHLIRNLQRYGWIVPYLFGSSPAVCKSFLCGKPTVLEDFNDNSYYGPYATSLRMCDIGYQNAHEYELGFKADYNSLDSYIDSLSRAITTSCDKYAQIGVKVDGEYRQLNSNMLQIENEYYSSVRPKQVPGRYEKPVNALRERGVRYVELRSLDINMFDPVGISETQCLFLETLMAFCLVHESPNITQDERAEIDFNLDAVCYRGREPGLVMQHHGETTTLSDWAGEILDRMQGFAGILDAPEDGAPYLGAVRQQQQAIKDPGITLSAQVLDGMRTHNEGYFHFAKRMSLYHQDYFMDLPDEPERFREFEEACRQSVVEQAAIESLDTLSFDEFLERYFEESLNPKN